MKNDIEIPVPKDEDTAAAKMRRENYALARDLQASDYNEAIAKRMQLKTIFQVKCEKCGKEFTSETDMKDSPVCPECE